jgi:hypothetical protein
MQAFQRSPDVRIKSSSHRPQEVSNLRLQLAETRNKKILQTIDEEERKEHKREQNRKELRKMQQQIRQDKVNELLQHQNIKNEAEARKILDLPSQEIRKLRQMHKVTSPLKEVKKMNARNKSPEPSQEPEAVKMTFDDIHKSNYKQILKQGKEKDVFKPSDFLDLDDEQSDDEILKRFRKPPKNQDDLHKKYTPVSG